MTKTEMPALLCLATLSLLAAAGCATQRSVDDLNARVTKLEAKRPADRTALISAMDAAESQRSDCRVGAEKRFNEWLHSNGTPVKGQPGIFNASAEGIKQAQAEQERENADCQREYEDAVQAAKTKYSE